MLLSLIIILKSLVVSFKKQQHWVNEFSFQITKAQRGPI